MARFKPVHKGMKLLPVDLDRQLVPGTFEHALNYLVDHELDLSALEARYCNDEQGASAYDPAVLLKIILLAYSRGLIGSRRIEAACRENIVFMALSGDSQPHFTTLAAFVAELGDQAARLFAQVLTLCDRQGLIGREMFAIDGVKLPGNASKTRSGTRADFLRRAEKMEAAAKKMLDRHRAADAVAADSGPSDREARQLARLQADARKYREWLTAHPQDRTGARGAVRLSNQTDNESAKMATGKGVIQGYTGVAAVDGRAQVIVEAQAHGTGSEQELLWPVVKATGSLRTPATLITADAGYHSEANLKALAEAAIPALIADPDMRARDERFKDQDRHKAKPDPLHPKGKAKQETRRFRPADFDYDPEAGTCRCPAGKALYQNGSNCTHNGYLATKFTGAQRDCVPCGLRNQCLRTPEKTQVRQVCFFRGKAPETPESHTDRMKRAIDSEEGRRRYGRRFATVEPVFGNVRANKRMDRFTLRGRAKVDGQWKLYCMVHNIEKLAHQGYAR